MTHFGFASATITRPDGSTLRGSAVLRDGTLRVGAAEDGQTIVEAQQVYSEGRQGWKVVAADGTWTVKRDGGCGCGK